MKKYINCIFFASILLLAAYPVKLNASEKGGPFLSGADPVVLGRGGTGVSVTGADSFMLNPASVSLAERASFSVDYGSLDGDYVFPYTSLLMPGAYGVLGLGLGCFQGSPGDVDSTGYMFTMGLSKEITSGFLFGLAFNGLYWDAAGNNFYIGVMPGIILKFDSSDSYNGFGIFNPATGFSAGLGYASSDEADLNSVTLGYSFGFYRSQNYILGFYNDISAINGFGSYPVKFGFQWDYNSAWHVRLGAALPESYSYMAWTAGAGYTFTGETSGLALDYAFTWSGEEGVSHYAGVRFEYGSLDREPPVIEITPDYTCISPNYDGIQDEVMFDIEVNDSSRIKGWRLQITDERDMVVREFTVSEREMEDSLTPLSFLERFVTRKDALTVPGSILWDGTDATGKKLPDGRYRFYFYAWDARDNIAPVKSGYIVIDTTSPEAALETESLIFSPNGDGNKESLVIKQKIVTSKEDIWRGEIKNAEGIPILVYEWDGTNVPSKFVWLGKGPDDKPVPDGVYYYSLASTDSAGNRTYAAVKEIILTTVTDVADIRPAVEYFSYTASADKYIRFFADVSSNKGMERWEITISEPDGDPVKVISGTGQVSSFVDWDCRDLENKKLDDGEYYVRLSVWYSSGNNPASYPKKIIFDNSAPDIDISHSPGLFSPDGDGENDYLTISTSAKDYSGVANWEIGIYTESGLLFRKFTGKGTPPESFRWDGLNDKGDLVESASDYTIQFFAVDAAGNVSATETDNLPVDVLVVVTERGLKIRISNIEFGFGSAVIKKRGTKILDRVYEILEKYSSYKVVIEGHSDDVGDEEVNLALSEKRALAVRDYLVKKGTDPARLRYVGMGESMPFYPNTNDENRRRNRRVEFLLIKEKSDK